MRKVVKFGGSSMADAVQFQKVRDIVLADPKRTVVIVSAPGKRFSGDHKITDLLYLCHAHIKYGVPCDSIFDMVKERYLSICSDLGLSIDMEAVLEELRKKMEAGISQDELVSRGECLCAMLMADYLGFDFLDAAQWLYFNLDGSVNQERSYFAPKTLAEGRRVVIPGFYGVLPDGSVRTFSRGGSDITGALAAAAIDAEVYENWTDVSGILMADPRIVENPEPIAHVTYDELRGLSYAGAQVLHEGTVSPVREKNIPLNIRNTNDPDHPGTIICERFEEEAEQDARFITGVAGRKNFSIVTVVKSGMSSEAGALRRILKVFDQYGATAEFVPSGIDSYSLVVAADKLGPNLCVILGALQEAISPDDIKVTSNISIITAVGRKMAFRPGTSGRIFAALGERGINIRMISQGPEELSITVGVDDKDYSETIRVLYNSFVK